ncbi:MAG: S41 family peptidase [Elusimicrobiales bacterium]|nr:S41 family peptidase [Elusimicrobiales bacterium]
MKRALILLAAGLALPGFAAAYPESINGFHDPSSKRPVVFELPEGPGREKAEAYVKEIRDSFYKESELLDASAIPAAELAKKLAGGFLLYAVPGAKTSLLASIKKPGFKFSGAGLQFAGKEYAGASRLITLAANPYADGACQVYAASSNDQLAGINNLFHGPAAYYIFKGGLEVAAGLFDGRFNPVPETLPLADAIEDVNEFFSKAESIHPDLLANLEPDGYRELKRRTVNAVSEKLDKQRRVAIKDLAYELYYAAAAFGDGHTRMHYQNLPESEFQAANFPPFRVQFRNGAFFVSGALDKSLEGERVVAVNGAPFADFAAPALARCSGETFPFKAIQFSEKQTFWWAFTKLFSGGKQFELETRDSAGRARTRKLGVIGIDAAVELRKATEKPLADETSLRLLEDGSVAYFRYPSFRYSEAEKEKIDRIFAEAGKAKALIIDIRGNGGGNSAMGEHIMKYLTEKPVRSFSKMQVKVSAELLANPKYSRHMREENLAFAPGTLVTNRTKEEKQEKPAAFFGGKVYLLTDNATFSSASDFAAMFRDYECGRIIGYETGGLPTCFGDVFSLALTNSRLPFGVSYKKFYGPRPKPGDEEHGVLPDVPAADELLAKYKGPDPVLAFALDYIRGGN